MRSRTVDLVCVGGGLGGLAGAVAAHDAGLDVVVLEKAPLLGGVTAYSGGVVWAPGNHLQADEGFPDDLDQAERYLDWLTPTGLAADLALRSAYVRSAREVFEYYHRQVGIPFQVIPRPDQYYPDADGSLAGGRTLEAAVEGASLGAWQELTRRSPLFKTGITHTEVWRNGGPLVAYQKLADLYQARRDADFRTHGAGLVAAFVRAAQVQRAIPTHLGVRTTRLLQQDGRITGIEAVIDGEPVRIHARRGVLLATGSYGHADYAASAEVLPQLADASNPEVTGDHITLTDPTPAALVRAGEAIIHVGYRSPGTNPGEEDLHRPLYRAFGCPHSIVVNREGRRFADESFYGRFYPALRAFDTHTKVYRNFPCWLLVDDRFRTAYGLPPFEPGDSWDGHFSRGADLGELARTLGIDPDGLVDEVRRFNQGAARGVDPVHGRGEVEYARRAFGDPSYPNPNLGPIEQPPFWGVPLSFVGLGIYSMGLNIDAHARALTRDGRPVPGLYATGNAVAFTELPAAYTGGFANGRNIIYAYLAARHAAAGGQADPAAGHAARAR